MSTLTLTHPDRKSTAQLGRRIVFLIVTASALLSVVASAAQLYFSYQRDRDEVLESVSVIDQSLREGFENALWEFNFGLVQALLDGIYNKTDVEFVEMETTTGQLWTRGEGPRTDLIMETLTFQHRDTAGEVVPLGKMTIGLSLANAKERVWAQFWTLLLSNMAKAAGASLVILMIIDHLVIRHLRTIADYVAGSSWLDRTQVLRLDRRDATRDDDHGDELDHIVTAINEAKLRSAEAYKAMQTEIEQRRFAEQSVARKAERLTRLNELLVQTNREQADFTYAISHDLKSPTNTVSMLLDELVLGHADVLDGDATYLIERAQKTVARMGRLVEDVLKYSCTVEQKVVTEPVNLNLLVQDILEDLQSDIGEADADIELGELPVVSGNALQLRLLFQNLICNAIKFRSPDRPLEVTIRSTGDRDGRKQRIAISDNGIGIAPEFHERIFGLFQRLHSYEAFPGSGLGLALCQRIVANHGDRIDLRSAPGEGSTFAFSLPRDLPI